MRKPIYCVITKVPNYPLEDGNTADELMGKFKGLDSDIYLRSGYMEFIEGTMMSVKIPVFHLGEILILNESLGREIAGQQRMPYKWFVEYEEFKSIKKAIERSLQVMKEKTP